MNLSALTAHMKTCLHRRRAAHAQEQRALTQMELSVTEGTIDSREARTSSLSVLIERRWVPARGALVLMVISYSRTGAKASGAAVS